MAVSKTFAAVGNSATQLLKPGQRAIYTIQGAGVATIQVVRFVKGSDSPTVQMANSAGTLISTTGADLAGMIQNDMPKDILVAFQCQAYTSGSPVCLLTDMPLPVAGQPLVTQGIGAPNGATVFADERGLNGGVIHQTTLYFANTPVTVADATVGVGVKVYDFPEGRIAFRGAVGAIQITTTSVIASTLNSAVTCNWGLGSTTQASATLATTEQDIIPTTAVTSSATINIAAAVSKAKLAATFQLDGTTTAVDCYLNIALATATDIDADATILYTGYVVITWENLGDY